MTEQLNESRDNAMRAALSSESMWSVMTDELEMRKKLSKMAPVGPTAPTPSVEIDFRAVVHGATAIIEMAHFGAAMTEALERLGLSSVSDLASRFDEVAQDISATMSIEDPVQVVSHYMAGRRTVAATTENLSDLTKSLVAMLPGFLKTFPLHEVTDMADAIGCEHFAHRIRVAYDGLQAFLLRTHEPTKRETEVVGRAYASGSITLTEACTVLQMSAPNAVAFFEERGYCRAIGAIALTSERRAAAFANIRAGYVARGGEPKPSSEIVDRAVIASERIEGVDARAWLAQS